MVPVSPHDEMALSGELAHMVLGSIEMSEVPGRIVEAIKIFIGAESGALLLLDEKTGELCFKVVSGGKAQREIRLAPGSGLAWTCVLAKEAILVPDTSADPRFTGDGDGYGAKSFLALPLISQGRVLGVVQAVNKRGGGAFDEGDLARLRGLAPHICLAIQHALSLEELKKSKDHLERLREHLEDKVADRTLAYEKAKALIIHREKMASLGRMAAGLAHEINNPLAALQANIAAIPGLFQDYVASAPEERLAMNTDLKELVTDCQIGIRRISNIIENLRSFAQDRESKEVENDLSGELLLLKTLLEKQGGAGCTLTMNTLSLPKVLVSPALVAHAMLNLGGYLMSFPGELCIDYRPFENEVALCLSHRAFPLAADTVRELFAPFASVSQDDLGGLELATAHGLIEHSGGRIEVSDLPEGGVVFMVYLPTKYHPSKSGKITPIRRSNAAAR